MHSSMVPTARSALAIGFVLSGAARAQLVTTDAGVISTAIVIAKERVEWLASDDADEFRATTALSFSAHQRLQFDVSVPLVVRDVDVPTLGSSLRGRQQGLGDIDVATKWALLREDDVMRSDRLSVLGNLRLPTGDDDSEVDGIDLGPRAALGLDQFGGALGLGYTLVRDRHRAAVALRGWLWETRDGFTPAPQVTLDTAWWYRLAPREFTRGVETIEWRGVVELLSRWNADDELGAVDVRNGGAAFTGVLGLQANVNQSLSLEAGILVPLDDTTESPFGELRHGFLFSLKLFF